MKDALTTLFLPVHNESISIEGKKILFLNAIYDSLLADGNWECRQVFKPYAHTLESNNIQSKSDYECNSKSYDLAFILFPKNIAEGLFLIATALLSLKKDGTLICAAENKAGGNRLSKILKDFDLKDLNTISKHKCRVVWAGISGFDQIEAEKALKAGEPKKILDGKYLSQTGIYGWDKIDLGSKLLCDVLPSDLKGYGADFGCGYGYLADYALEHCPKIKHIECHDADHRAIMCCAENLSNYEGRTSYHWTDLSAPFKPRRLLDFIIMNPPFHEGKKTQNALGKAFIKNASKVLRRKGELWMVANAHLPYEETLETYFFKVEKIVEKQGFKVYRAEK
ncbi:MAG: methyltransferase [Alphaproteobacteria bacterium]|nr:methyltransferase [Alphaproteobacteria bacterium]